MGRVGTGRIFGRAFALGLAVAICATAGRSDDKKAADSNDALKEEILKLNRKTGDEAQKETLLALAKNKAKAKKMVALAYQMQKEAKPKDRPLHYTGSVLIARIANYVKNYEAAEYFYEQCVKTASELESGEKILQSYDGLIDTYWDAKRYDDVVDTCEKFVELKGPEEVNQAKPLILERLVQAKARQGKIDEALRITESLTQLYEGSFYFVQLKGWVQREGGKFNDAIETYLDVLDKLDAAKQLPDKQRDTMKDRVRYILSGLYIDVKDVPKAAKQLETLVKKDPENPTYKNDLGFVWADNDMKLEEAKKLIEEALVLDRKRQEKQLKEKKIDEVKETAAYLDSMGWVLYKLKKPKEALPYLKKAAADEDEGSHLEIWDHLGDVYKALDNKKEAVAAWQKALSMEDVSKRDEERRKSVIKKLKAEGVEPIMPPKKAPPKKKKVVD